MDANQNDVDWEAQSVGSQHRGSSLFSQSAQHRPAGGLTANATEPFMQIVDSYIRWYNEKRIKISLGSLSPIEYRASLGFTA